MHVKGEDLILDMRVLNTDAASYVQKNPERIILAVERGKT